MMNCSRIVVAILAWLAIMSGLLSSGLTTEIAPSRSIQPATPLSPVGSPTLSKPATKSPEGMTCDSCYIHAYHSGEKTGEDWRGASGISSFFSIVEPLDVSFVTKAFPLLFTPSIQITIDGGTWERHPGETIRVHVGILPTCDLSLFYHPDVLREGGGDGGLVRAWISFHFLSICEE